MRKYVIGNILCEAVNSRKTFEAAPKSHEAGRLTDYKAGETLYKQRFGDLSLVDLMRTILLKTSTADCFEPL